MKQVDILISINQVLQVLYLKHHVYKTSLIIMNNKLTKSTKIDPHKFNKYTLQYKLLQHNKTQSYLIADQPS